MKHSYFFMSKDFCCLFSELWTIHFKEIGISIRDIKVHFWELVTQELMHQRGIGL